MTPASGASAGDDTLSSDGTLASEAEAAFLAAADRLVVARFAVVFLVAADRLAVAFLAGAVLAVRFAAVFLGDEA